MSWPGTVPGRYAGTMPGRAEEAEYWGAADVSRRCVQSPGCPAPGRLCTRSVNALSWQVAAADGCPRFTGGAAGKRRGLCRSARAGMLWCKAVGAAFRLTLAALHNRLRISMMYEWLMGCGLVAVSGLRRRINPLLEIRINLLAGSWWARGGGSRSATAALEAGGSWEPVWRPDGVSRTAV